MARSRDTGTVGTPTPQDFISVADYTYNQGTTSTAFPEPPLTPLMFHGKPLEDYNAATGFYGEAFVTSKDQVIVGFEGTNLFTADLTPPQSTAAQFTASQVIDDADIYAGVDALSYKTALNFTQQAIHVAHLQNISKNNVFLAGHSLGAADAEYVATKTGLSGTTFGTPGIPAADINPKVPSKLTNYSIDADPVGNYFSGSLLGSIVNNPNIEQYGGSISLKSSLISPYIDASYLLSDAAEDYAGGTTLDLADAASQLAIALTYHPLANYATALSLNLPEGDISLLGLPLCFAAGSRLRSPAGYTAIETLKVGDDVITASGEIQKITWLGHRTMDCRHRYQKAVSPIRIMAHAFGENIPVRKLYLSPGHPVLVGATEAHGGHLVPIMCLINGTTIERVAVDEVTYWHVELKEHDILLAEGLPAESYIDLGSRPWFAGAEGALHDPDMALPGMPGRCRPVAIDGPVVEAERRRLDMVFATRLAAAAAWPAAEDFLLEM